MMDEYTKKIVEYINNLQFSKKIENPTHIIYFKSKVCGDANKIYMYVDNNETIIDLGYDPMGCSLNLASLEIFCNYLKGKSLSDIKKIDSSMISKILDFPLRKAHCVDLAIDTLKNL